MADLTHPLHPTDILLSIQQGGILLRVAAINMLIYSSFEIVLNPDPHERIDHVILPSYGTTRMDKFSLHYSKCLHMVQVKKDGFYDTQRTPRILSRN